MKGRLHSELKTKRGTNVCSWSERKSDLTQTVVEQNFHIYSYVNIHTQINGLESFSGLEGI